MKDVSDGELMKELANGNKKAFQALFHRHSSLVLGYATRLFQDSALAEDASQETWIRVVHGSSRYEEQLKFRSWLLRIVRNCSMNLLESRKSFNASLTLEEVDEVNLTSPAEILNDPRLSDLKNAIQELPDAQRVALVIWLAEEPSYEQLATELKTTVQSVKSLLFRARKNLENQLKGVSLGTS